LVRRKPKSGRRQASLVSEQPAKVLRVLEAQLKGGFVDGERSGQQQPLRFFNQAVVDVLRVLARQRAQHIAQVGGRSTG